jgi:uncharacterized protein YdhG (YjbR/CyaY superfamily)
MATASTIRLLPPEPRGAVRSLMAAEEIDAYLAPLDEAKRATLEEVRRRILLVIPDAEQGISYRMPAFRRDGQVVAGFAAFTKHLSYLPHSGVVLARLAPMLEGYERTSGSLHFAVGEPLPESLIEALIGEKLRVLEERGAR